MFTQKELKLIYLAVKFYSPNVNIPDKEFYKEAAKMEKLLNKINNLIKQK